MTKQIIKRTARRFAKDEKGAALIEYSILIGIITAGVIVLVIAVGAWVTGKWASLNALLP